MFFTHLRRNGVAYLALVVALGTGSAYAAGSIPNGSVTAAKLHTNAVTSTKIKNGTIKAKDLRKPTFVQSTTLVTGTPPAVPDLVSVAPYDFSLPNTGRTSVTVFIPTIGGSCDNANPDQPTIGLYIDNVPIPLTAATVPAAANDRSIQLTATLLLKGGVHTGRVGITCNGASAPNVAAPGAKTWTIIVTG
ncbi:MAG: hypothetical protein QOD98_1520 [Nocardioidaceae bacterium]|jgi:hypothetical protein|nr:hypothetical protein [Nocardioidaceae bacterium]